MTERTVIVGGGMAGLAAAVALAERGIAVTLLESRPRLGGRASSFLDKTTGTKIDNCQHVSLGCCTNFQHFCRTVGLDELFRTERELYFIGRDNVVNRLSADAVPAPFHLLFSFGRLSYLSAGDLMRIALGVRALARTPADGSDSTAILDWLRRHRQTPRTINRFWTPLLVSALSETLDRIDVANARKELVDAFLANREGWRVQIPTAPLDVLYGTRVTGWLAARGANVRLQAGVERIAFEKDRATGAVLRGGELVPGDQFILAVPNWLVLDLLPQELRADSSLSKIGELESAPISSVHLWFDRPILFPETERGAFAVRRRVSAQRELPHAMFIDRFSQWIFNRSLLQSASSGKTNGNGHPQPPSSPEEGYAYQVVISASRNVLDCTQQETISKVLAELGELFPRYRDASLLHSRLVTEHRAVFSPRPGAESCRPAQQSPIPNVQLAGDWTRTGWPATMEGAVRSGYLAAQNVLEKLGRAETLLQPDLPVSPLSRLLLGLKT